MTTSTRLHSALGSAVVVLLLIGSALPAHGQLGVAAGLNFESAGDIQASDRSATLENSTGYHVGLVYEFSIGPIGLRPGVLYRRVGSFEVSADQLDDAQYTVSAWEVPVDVKLTVFPTPLVSPYLVGGPKATLPSGEGDFDEAVRDFSYTFNIGIGAELSLPVLPVRLQPELRYEFGAAGFIEEGRTVKLGDENVSFTPADSPRFSTLALRVHVLF